MNLYVPAITVSMYNVRHIGYGLSSYTPVKLNLVELLNQEREQKCRKYRWKT